VAFGDEGRVFESGAAKSMTPLIEVPPRNNRRGVRGDGAGQRAGAGGVLDHRPVDDALLHCRARPLHHGDGDGLRRPGADRPQHARIGESIGIAAALQLEAARIDAA